MRKTVPPHRRLSAPALDPDASEQTEVTNRMATGTRRRLVRISARSKVRFACSAAGIEIAAWPFE